MEITQIMRVYVLLFNARTENEGLHTLTANGRNTVLLFESEDDATRFGLMLEAQDFPLPTVEEMDREEMEEFCREAGYDWRFIPTGSLAVPPEANVEATDWKADGSGKAADSRERRDRGDRGGTATLEPEPEEDESGMSQEEMDRIRRQLEKLL